MIATLARDAHVAVVACALWFCACGVEDVDVIVAKDATVASGNVGDASDGCVEGTVQQCACEAGLGTQRCNAGALSRCEGCSMAVVSRCVAGSYIGEARGKSRPSAAGIPGVVAAVESDAFGRWQFSLQSTGDQEFYTVGNGCILFSDAATQNAVSARLYATGDVDCQTGIFRGELRGFYVAPSAVNLAGSNFYFKGTISGTFNPDTRSFESGMYAYKEAPSIFGNAGGEGMWRATLSSEPVNKQTLEECLMGPFPEASFP